MLKPITPFQSRENNDSCSNALFRINPTALRPSPDTCDVPTCSKGEARQVILQIKNRPHETNQCPVFVPGKLWRKCNRRIEV
ncbi:hypothetical protein JTB14_012759 [Gonioctena quinquepunctata]|nr:hypothetical protein JTB14_012759 [Gonioctena quinquepunctata]